MYFARILFLVSLVSGLPAAAHEFWIEPQQYQVESGAPLIAELKNGQNFSGATMAWFDNRFTRFETVLGDAVTPVDGRLGDSPALQTIAPKDGLLVILHETTPSSLKYKTWEKFMAFVEHKDFQHAAALHDDMGWVKEDFYESYTRHVKALVGVGNGAGADKAFGLATEFVALTNPYAPDFDGNMKVLVNYQGAPRPDAQIEVFDRAPDGEVTVTLVRTDAAGQSSIPVTPGHDYLFDAVVLIPSPQAGTDERAPLWETLWAALSFSVPE